MGLTKEQVNKIKVELNTVIGQYLFDGTLHTIQAECLLKWAYRRVETWPNLLEVCKSVADLAHACANGKLKTPGKAESLRRHKENWRWVRDTLQAEIAKAEIS